jgi:nicotinate-nucleotide adenylyltransferase
MERIGIYGGSFNPPHIGHIQAAHSAAKSLGLTKILLLPANQPPHKSMPADVPTAQQRLEMLRIAVENEPVMEVSDLEIARGGVSYTYETVSTVRAQYPDAQVTKIERDHRETDVKLTNRVELTFNKHMQLVDID